MTKGIKDQLKYMNSSNWRISKIKILMIRHLYLSKASSKIE